MQVGDFVYYRSYITREMYKAKIDAITDYYYKVIPVGTNMVLHIEQKDLLPDYIFESPLYKAMLEQGN